MQLILDRQKKRMDNCPECDTKGRPQKLCQGHYDFIALAAMYNDLVRRLKTKIEKRNEVSKTLTEEIL